MVGLPEGTPLLLLLKLNKTVNKYEIVGSIAGAFEVDRQGKLRHLVRPPVDDYARFNGIDMADAVGEIHQLRSER